MGLGGSALWAQLVEDDHIFDSAARDFAEAEVSGSAAAEDSDSDDERADAVERHEAREYHQAHGERPPFLFRLLVSLQWLSMATLHVASALPGGASAARGAVAVAAAKSPRKGGGSRKDAKDPRLWRLVPPLASAVGVDRKGGHDLGRPSAGALTWPHLQLG
eukprot:CAMPEP_0180643520 /NCGR_PEP_ID=MMETSP1037_2-20121125/47861_1 /TAXON_ID=632150 /ORGANISM="Azadinium spinosum, Strain 3D9" /LENGTH=161 /DNA_ID=CAMNT_0022667039 /DNA_START=14 /DNA_END=496 /DNA_ORIENTATION=-